MLSEYEHQQMRYEERITELEDTVKELKHSRDFLGYWSIITTVMIIIVALNV